MVRQIKRRVIIFKIDDMELDKELFSSFVKNRQILEYIHLTDGLIVIKANQKISLNSGMRTLQNLLMLPREPVLMNAGTYTPLVQAVIHLHMGGCYGDHFVKEYKGIIFSPEFMKATTKSLGDSMRNKRRNELISTFDVDTLIKTGVVTFENRSRIKAAKEEEAESKRENNLQPDLSGVYSHTFNHYAINVVTKRAYMTNLYMPRTVEIEGFVGATDIKLKSWWIYSKMGGFGKTHFLQEFMKKYNAFVVKDANNYIGVPENTQFLCFDETGALPRTFDSFKSFTSGNGSMASGNRKGHGKSFIPREDVQIIVTCNKSPEEVYGIYDCKLQRKFMSKDMLSQLDQRVNIVCLDGSITEERRKFVLPLEWSDEELYNEILSLKPKRMRDLEDPVSCEGEIKEFIRKGVGLLKAKFGAAVSRFLFEKIIRRDQRGMVNDVDNQCMEILNKHYTNNLIMRKRKKEDIEDEERELDILMASKSLFAGAHGIGGYEDIEDLPVGETSLEVLLEWMRDVAKISTQKEFPKSKMLKHTFCVLFGWHCKCDCKHDPTFQLDTIIHVSNEIMGWLRVYILVDMDKSINVFKMCDTLMHGPNIAAFVERYNFGKGGMLVNDIMGEEEWDALKRFGNDNLEDYTEYLELARKKEPENPTNDINRYLGYGDNDPRRRTPTQTEVEKAAKRKARIIMNKKKGFCTKKGAQYINNMFK